MIAVTQDAVDLMMQGTIALAQVERNGIKIDTEYLDRTIQETEEKIILLEKEFKQGKIWKKWKQRFGSRTQLGSHPQLEKIVFEDMGYTRSGRQTEKGQDAADMAAFENVDHPEVKIYFQIEKLKKANGTYLKGIANETIDGYAYPIPNLHTAVTYRSSYDRFNMQNQPVRDPFIGEIIRKCYIAPKGFHIGELDYGGIEVCLSACHHKDPKMIKYITDPTTDMHRDMAAQCYMLPKNEVSKMSRYCAKNMFVFPEFYGSFWRDCSQNLWEAIGKHNLTTASGLSLKEHLKQKGIKKLGETVSNYETGRISTKKGTFMEHIRLVEEDFWKKRFRVYDQWKRDWWSKYLKKGYFQFLTGFIGQGIYNRKQVCNSPIQGSAFHCLLWSLIKLQKWLNKNKMKSYIPFEIHDSIGMYFHKNEVDYVLEKAVQIMTIDIVKHWSWICVPLTVEAEIAPLGASWFHKEKVQL